MSSFITQMLFPYLAPHRRLILVTIFFSFLLAGLGALQVSLVKPIFDQGLSADSSRFEIIKLAGMLLFLGLLHFPCRFYHFYWIRLVVERINCHVREQLFAKIQGLPTATLSKNKQGEYLSYVLNDSLIFSNGARALIDLVREPLKAIAYLGMAIWADWQLTLVILVITPFLIAIFSVSGKKVRSYQGNVQQEHASLTHTISEGIGAHKLTKAFNLQNFVMNRFRFSQNKFLKAQMKTTYVEEMAHPLVELVGAMAFSGVIIFAHHRIQSGATTVGEFISFVAALALFMDPLRKFSQANVKLGQSRAASERIQKVLSEMDEPDSGQRNLTQFTSSIEINNLSFTYGEGEILKSINATIKRGQKVAFVGLSGSGKSTLIHLLLGLYPVKSGSILIDDTSLEELKLHQLRSLFGLVSQDIFLFNDTIRENLCLGVDFDEAQIKQALNVAYAEEFISKLPLGIETVVGDRGTRLSGGQQQRITIARAFLHNPEILLFDEATSALDNESEKVVLQALEKIGSQKTVIAVAHRLSTIQHYDVIFVLKDGVLVESGDHSQLISLDGEYAKLYQLSTRT
jgi:ATP-binding cassette, subfamily B, bacterial MsbA